MLRKLEHPAKNLKPSTSYCKLHQKCRPHSGLQSNLLYFIVFIICFRQTDRFKAIKSSPNIFFWKHNRTVTTLFVKYHKLVKILVKVLNQIQLYHLSIIFVKKNDKILFLKKYFVKPQNYDQLPKFY